MEFKQLQSFVEVVRNRSFTKASQELFIYQPTVSMHISQLESELGVRLIVRNTKSIEVTDLGRKLYEYAVNLLAFVPVAVLSVALPLHFSGYLEFLLWGLGTAAVCAVWYLGVNLLFFRDRVRAVLALIRHRN